MKMNKMQFRGRFPTETEARKITDPCERDGLQFEIKRDGAAFIVFTERQTFGYMQRTAAIGLKKHKPDNRIKFEPIIANVGKPKKTSWPKGKAENEINNEK